MGTLAFTGSLQRLKDYNKAIRVLTRRSQYQLLKDKMNKNHESLITTRTSANPPWERAGTAK